MSQPLPPYSQSPTASLEAPVRENRNSPATGSFRFVLFASAVTAIGGFLFGYDTAVINGANTYLQAHFGLDATRDALLAVAGRLQSTLGGAPIKGVAEPAATR